MSTVPHGALPRASLPKVSVVIAAYNHGRYIGRAIRSVLAQTFPPLELIIVDDGSTDGTGELIRREFNAQISYHYQANRGPSAARNTGVRLCSGDWIAFLDADDYWMPEKLDLQVAEIMRNPEVGMVVCDGLKCSAGGEILGHWQFPLPHPLTREAIRAELIWRSVFAMAGVVVRHDVFERLGGFREDTSYGEDHELWARIVASSCEIAAVHRQLFKVTSLPQSLSHNPDLAYHYGGIVKRRVRELLLGPRSWPWYWIDNRQEEARMFLYAAWKYEEQEKKGKAALTLIRGLAHWPLLRRRSYKSVYWLCLRLLLACWRVRER